LPEIGGHCGESGNGEDAKILPDKPLQDRVSVSPRLETIVMVESFIAENSGQFTRFQVWQRLPRKMMYQTFQVILAYLESSRKIAVGTGGRLYWLEPNPPNRILSRNGNGRQKEGLTAQ